MPLPDGEVLFVSRRNLLFTTAIGALVLLIGLWVIRRPDSGAGAWFLGLWCALWFLGGGLAFFGGLWGLLFSPPRFARIGDDGLEFFRHRAPLVPWTHILEARLGPKKTTDREGTHYTIRHPLVLRLRDRSAFPERGWLKFAFPMTALPDGSFEWTTPLDGCPCGDEEFLAKIQARLPLRPPASSDPA